MSRIKPADHLTFFQRLLVIIQLCLALSVLLWYSAQPFLGEYFNIKSKLMLYEYVKGNSSTLSSDLQKRARIVNAWEALPQMQKDSIQARYDALKKYAERPALTKIIEGISQLIHLPPFELAWIFFSIWVSILLLRERQGAFLVVWLIPLIAICYAIDNRVSGVEPTLEPDYGLIPTEKFLAENYLQQEFNPHWLEQKNQLTEAWNRFLVHTYLNEEIREDHKEQQIEKAGYLFTLARLMKQAEVDPAKLKTNFHEKVNLLMLIAIVLWNLFFAWKLRACFLIPGVGLPIEVVDTEK